MRLVHIAEGIHPDFGGTSEYIRMCSNTQVEHGLEVFLSGPFEEASLPENWHKNIAIQSMKPYGPRKLGLWKGAEELDKLQPLSLMHIHGLWLDGYRSVAKWATKNTIPYVVSMHGMLEPWALQRSARPKKVMWSLWQKEMLQQAACLQVTTQREAQNIRKKGIETPIAVIPNGISVDLPKTLPSTPITHQDFIFLGRLHPVKSLSYMLDQWAQIEPEFPRSRFIIIGPDEGGHLSELQQQVNELNITERVLFKGPLYGDDKIAALANARFLVLPSAMESFGLCAVEAMVAGTPVITSTDTPWEMLEEKKLGKWLPREGTQWQDALREYLTMPDEDIIELGQKCSQWCKASFDTWTVTQQLIHAYQWLIKKGDKPTCII